MTNRPINVATALFFFLQTKLGTQETFEEKKLSIRDTAVRTRETIAQVGVGTIKTRDVRVRNTKHKLSFNCR
jgi:hypothetical protein